MVKTKERKSPPQAGFFMAKKNKIIIGLFDSGIGVQPIAQFLENYIKHYKLEKLVETKVFMDKDNFPYGNKSYSELKRIVDNNLQNLSKNGCDVIGIACNTASIIYTMGKTETTTKVIPIIEISAKLASDNAKRFVHVISSNFTANSHIYTKTISGINQDLFITESGEQKLIKAIEDNDQVIIKQEYLRIFSELPSQVDTLVLGCTHFSKTTKQVYKFSEQNKHRLTIVDPAKEMAKKLLTEAIQALKRQMQMEKIALPSKYEVLTDEETKIWL